MAKLIYSMFVSLDGYAEDAEGRFGWGFPEDEAVHGYINEAFTSVGTYLYGRRMYETMVYWETADAEPDQHPIALDYARQWKAAGKIVFSRTLVEPSSERTRIERAFDPEMVRELKRSSAHDLSIDGPELASHAIRAGLVDEFVPIVCPVIVGGGKQFFPDDLRIRLSLQAEKRFDNGVMLLRYATER